MRFFSRPTAPVQAAAAVAELLVTPERRRPSIVCAGCRVVGMPLVYVENGRDYCLPCAARCWNAMRLSPAGRRIEDLTLAEVLS